MERLNIFSLLAILLMAQACSQSGLRLSDEQLLAAVQSPAVEGIDVTLAHPISMELAMAMTETSSSLGQRSVEVSSTSVVGARTLRDAREGSSTRLDRRGSVSDRLKAIQLRRLVYQDERFNWRYQMLRTNQDDAAAFTGNCLDFASWIVTHARYLGLTANYELVTDASGWASEDGTWMRLDHVVAVVTVGNDSFRFDVTGQQVAEFDSQPLSDLEASALALSNQAVVAWRNENLELAAGLAKEAVFRFPDHAGLWLNLGNFSEPSDSLKMALLTRASQAEIAPEMGLSGLASFYQYRGDVRRAQFIERQIANYLEVQPRTHIGRAEEAINEEEYVEAIEHLQRAVELSPQTVELQYSLAALYSRTGSIANAEKMLSRARAQDSAKASGVYYAKLTALQREAL